LMQNTASRTVYRKQVAKACDPCRRRKTKCNGVQPCAGCLSAKLACTFNAPRGQGGRTGPRANVLNGLRAIPHNDADVFDPQDAAPTAVVTAAVELTREVFKTLVDVYEKRIYRIVALVPAERLREEFMQMQTSPTSRQLIYAFCAYMANFAEASTNANCGSTQSSQTHSQTYYLDHTLLSLQRDRITQLDHRSVYTSFFLYGAYAGRGDYRQAWFYLREATTLFMMLKDEDRDWFDMKTRTRLFWILVVSERYAKYFPSFLRLFPHFDASWFIICTSDFMISFVPFSSIQSHLRAKTATILSTHGHRDECIAY